MEIKRVIEPIKLKESTHTLLNSVGERNETFDDIIRRLAEKEAKRK